MALISTDSWMDALADKVHKKVDSDIPQLYDYYTSMHPSKCSSDTLVNWLNNNGCVK